MRRRRKGRALEPAHAALVDEWRTLWRSGTPEDFDAWHARHGEFMERLWDAGLDPETVAEWADAAQT